MVSPDLSVFDRLKTKRDFDREAEDRDFQRVLRDAEIRKAQMVDVEGMGEQAFFKAAQGLQLTPAEEAAARFVDAKSGGVSFNPVTGELLQKPRISEKIGLGGMQSPQMGGMSPPAMGDLPDMQLPPVGTFATADDIAKMGNVDDYVPPLNEGALIDGSMPPLPSATYLNPKEALEKRQLELKAGQEAITGLRDKASTASNAASTASRIKMLADKSGYTGLGAPVVGFADKVLTGLGAPNLIAGETGAREALAKESVDAWVSSVEPLKGALSNTEGNRFDAVVPSLNMTKQGIGVMQKMTEAMSNRAKQKASFYDSYFQRTGSISGADTAWDNWASQNPVITDELINSALGKAQTSQPSPQAPKKGSLVDGYMFNGGDPSNPKSWKKVK